MMEKIKVQVVNNGNFEAKKFSAFTSVIGDGDIKTAATCCLVKALAEKILDDFEDSEETAFGDIIIIDKSTAEDVKILNAVCKMNYNIINAIGNVTPFFVSRSRLSETDDNIAVTLHAYDIVKQHICEAYLAACAYNNTIFHEGISVMYTNANAVILLPTASIKLHYGEFEEIYFEDKKKTIMLSNYDGSAAYTAARFLFKAAYGMVENIDEDIVEDIYVEKSIIKAIAKVMLINAEAED